MNILYLLGHKTLIEFEVPILNSMGFGVLIAKQLGALSNQCHTIHSDLYKFDKFIKLDTEIDKLNQIDWYSNHPVSNEIMDILNTHFKYIVLTILVGKGGLIHQLVESYKGTILYRFFGREADHSYRDTVIYAPNIKYIFSYPEIYSYELTLSNNFNDNSYVVPLGLSDSFINKYKNTYKPIINKICFVCCKINRCQYYTNIYNSFINMFEGFEYILLGKDNILDNTFNDLSDDEFYKKISECKLLYYHSKEKRHLHYHPLEAVVIGTPVIFHSESLLSSFLKGSPGMCNSIEEIYEKIKRILDNDTTLINSIIEEQNKVIIQLSQEYNKNIFQDVIIRDH